MIRSPLFLTPCVALVSYLGTRAYIGYARRKAIMDIPNERSSHTVPTPRGGGIVFVSIMLLFVCFMMYLLPSHAPLWRSLLGGGTIIAAVGWLDDRKNLSARIRLLVHALAVLWALLNSGGLPSLSLGQYNVPLGIFGYFLSLLGGIWLINLYNFMDGIDGLAAGEAVLVATAAGLLLLEDPVALPLLVLSAGTFGFLILNWSPAKVFMGDAGSGFLGYAFFVFALFTEKTGTLPILSWAILLSVFVVDATMTLFKRFVERKRLSEPHRDHLYQQFIRKGYPHWAVSSTVLAVTMVNGFLTFFYRNHFLLLFILIYCTLITAWLLVYSKQRMSH